MKNFSWICGVAACAALCTTHAKAPAKNALAGAFAEMSEGDQTEFIATVNRSLAASDKPLDARRMETICRVNRDAVRAASAKERKTVLAEVYATIPKECLPAMTDSFAAEMFSRKAAGFRDDDDSFVEFASAALLRISIRCRTADDFPGTRTAYAVIMFLKASEGKPASLREDFMIYIHSGTHEIARKEWIPAALGDGGSLPTYAPMVQAGLRGEEPEHRVALPWSPAENLNPLVGGELRILHAWDVSGPRQTTDEHGIPGDDGTASGMWRVPKAVQDPSSPWYRRRRGADPPERPLERPAGEPSSEPEAYCGQSL